jgi:hypothetical protein
MLFRRKFWILVLIIFLCFFVTISCKENQKSEYTRFIVNEGSISFSFEYPASFSKPYVDTSLVPESIIVDTYGLIEPGIDGSESLSFTISQISETFSNSTSMLEYDLKQAEEHRDFRLLERSLVTVDGNQGERVIYTFSGYYQTMESEPEIGTVYKTYFEHNDLIWKF